MGRGITGVVGGVAVLALLVGGAERADAEPLYQLTDLGTLPGGSSSSGQAINAAGRPVDQPAERQVIDEVINLRSDGM